MELLMNVERKVERKKNSVEKWAINNLEGGIAFEGVEVLRPRKARGCKRV